MISWNLLFVTIQLTCWVCRRLTDTCSLSQNIFFFSKWVYFSESNKIVLNSNLNNFVKTNFCLTEIKVYTYMHSLGTLQCPCCSLQPGAHRAVKIWRKKKNKHPIRQIKSEKKLKNNKKKTNMKLFFQLKSV